MDVIEINEALRASVVLALGATSIYPDMAQGLYPQLALARRTRHRHPPRCSGAPPSNVPSSSRDGLNRGARLLPFRPSFPWPALSGELSTTYPSSLNHSLISRTSDAVPLRRVICLTTHGSGHVDPCEGEQPRATLAWAFDVSPTRFTRQSGAGNGTRQ